VKKTQAIRTVETIVLGAIRKAGKRGLTTDEVETRTSLLHQTASPAVIKLRGYGMISQTGRKRPTRTGRRAEVHVATEFLSE
jgi:hypothetical protein